MPDIEEQNHANQEDFDGGADKLWSVYNKEAEVHDKVLMESLKSETDSIIIFAGLFSAVLTAFLVDASKKLNPDPAEQTSALLNQTVFLLNQISQQLGPNGSQVVISSPQPMENFQATRSDLRINIFWFMSLGFSLTAALAATLIQQWIRDYMQAPKRPIGSLQRARIRGFLSHGWTSSQSIQLLFGGISAFIHISLFLFFIGLADNLFSSSGAAVAIPTSIIIGSCALFYIACSAIPIFYTKTLYHTPLSKLFWGLAQMTRLRKYSNNTTGGRPVPVSADMDIGRFQIAMSHTADRMARDTEAIRWVLTNITDDDEFEPFIAGIRGSFSTLWGARVWENIFKEDGAQPWALSAVELLKIRIESLLKSCADSPSFLDQQTRFARACVCIDAVASLKLSLGGGLRFNIDGNLMMQVLMYFSRERKRRGTLEQEARASPSLAINSAPRLEKRVTGTLLEIQWKCLVLIAMKKMLRDTNAAWNAHAVWNANAVLKANAIRDAQAVADAKKAGDVDAIRGATKVQVDNAIRDMETVRDATAEWDASAAKDTNAPWDANPVWDLDVATAVRQVLEQLRIRRPIGPKTQDGLKCQDFTTPNEVKSWLDNKVNLNTEREQELAARKVDKEMLKAWSAAKQLRLHRRTGSNSASNISENILIRTIQKSLNALLHKAKLADHTDLKIIDLVNTLMQKTGGILEDLAGASFEWPSDVTRPGRNPIFSEIHGKEKREADVWDPRPYCVSAVLDNKWIMPHLLPPRMLISNLLVYANPYLGAATDPLTRSIDLDSPDLGAGVLDWPEIDELMTRAGGSRPRPFERQLWRLRDLHDGGIGFIIELFFATFRFLKPVSLTPESAWMIEATLQAITEDGQSESLKRPACQRCLMALREELEEVKKNEESNPESTRTTSDFILNLLQQLTNDVIKTSGDWYALSKEKKKNEGEQEQEQEEEEEEEQEEQEGALTIQRVYFNRE